MKIRIRDDKWWKQLGERLRRLRIQHNLSLKEVAEYLSVHFTTVSAWEKSRNKPSVDILEKLIKLYNVSIDYILGLENLSDKKYVDKWFTKLIMACEGLTPKERKEIVDIMIKIIQFRKKGKFKEVLK